MASGDKFYIADKATVDEVKGNIGSTTDTGGSSAAGSVFAKLNYLVSQVSSYLSNIHTYVSRIGSTNDSQGTDTTGTVMGKLNYVVSQIYSYLSSIYNSCLKIGTTTDIGGTTTTGTVMGKLNKILYKSYETPTDYEFIKMGVSTVQSIKFAYLQPIETEILNVNGKGYVGLIDVFGNTTSGTGKTTITKVYIDGELLFHFGITGTVTRKDIWFGGQVYPSTQFSGAIFNLSHYVNGNLDSMRAGLSKLLKFETSLRVLASSTSSDNNNSVSIIYGLEE